MTPISGFIFWMATGFVVATVYASFFEWTLHRFVMHRPLGKFRYPFESHALVHHRVFRADETYHLIHAKDAKTIPMAWWNGPVLVAVGLSPFVMAAFFLVSWGFPCGALLACAGYYAAYEYMHWCMHLPKKRVGGTVGDFLPAQRPSPAAPPLHEKEFQRGVATGGFVPGHAAAARAGAFQTGARTGGAGRATPREEAARGDGLNPIRAGKRRELFWQGCLAGASVGNSASHF